MRGIGIGTGLVAGHRRALQFLPTDLAGNILWLRADPANIILNGDDVSTWLDRSGAGNDATQGTAANQPVYESSYAGLNGRAAIKFTGAVNEFFQLTIDSLTAVDSTVFFAVHNGVGGTNPYYLWDADAGDRTIYTLQTGSGTGEPGYYDGSWHDDDVATPKTAQVVSFRFDGGGNTGEIFRDGSLIYTDTYTARRHTDGDLCESLPAGDVRVAEMVAYFRALNDAEREQVEAYMMARYGL